MDFAELSISLIASVVQGTASAKAMCTTIENELNSIIVDYWEDYSKGEDNITLTNKFTDMFKIRSNIEDGSLANLLLLYTYNYMLYNRKQSLNILGLIDSFDHSYYDNYYSGNDLKGERKDIIINICTFIVSELVQVKLKISDTDINELKPAIKQYVKDSFN